MEDTKLKNISLTYLKNATPEYISANISKELAFSICAYAMERGQVTANEVFDLWRRKLSIVFSFEDFSEIDWRHLTLICQNYFEKITYNVANSGDDRVYCKLLCWLKASYNFLDGVQGNANKFNLIGICLFLTFILDTVQKCYTFFRLNSRFTEWTSQKELVNSLHMLSLKLVSGCLDSLEEVNSVAYCTIIPFINRICLITMHNSYADIKTKIETWKYVAKFALKYDLYSNIGYNNDTIYSDWPKSPMRLLIFQVKRSLLVIYNQELNGDLEYVERYLRVTSFYLKILYELSTVFQHSNFPIAKELFEVSLLTMSAPDFIQSSNVLIFIKKHVLSGIINILPVMFKNSEFKQMVNNHVEESAKFCFEYIVTYLHACIPNVDVEFFASNTELLTKMFKRIFQCGDTFVDASRFDEIIVIYATLTLMDSTQSLLRNMKKFVIKGNSALSLACTEVLILVSSLDNRSDELKNKIEFWIQVHNQFARCSSNFKRLNVERLTTYNCMLYSRHRSTSIIQTHAFGYNYYLDNNDISRSYNVELESSKEKVCNKLYGLMEMYECNEISVEDYYEIVNAMYKLARCEVVISKDLQKKIGDFIETILNSWMLNAKYSCKRLLTAGLVLISTSTGKVQFKILSFIKNKFLQSGIQFSTMAFWLFLNAFYNQQICSELCNIAQSIITNSEIPDIIRVSIFESVTQNTFNTSVDFQHYTNVENKGKCTKYIKPYFVQRKRLKREIDGEESELEDVIQNVCVTLKKIVLISKHLKQSDIEKLNNVCIDIKKVTDSYYNK